VSAGGCLEFKDLEFMALISVHEMTIVHFVGFIRKTILGGWKCNEITAWRPGLDSRKDAGIFPFKRRVWSRDSSVGIVSGQWDGRLGNCGLIAGSD